MTSVGLLLLLLSNHVVQSRDERQLPNFVFILADDLGWNDVGYHNSFVKTPYLDQLASGGLKLESAYALSLCSPSRAALLTGRYPYCIGMQSFVLTTGNDKPLPLHLKLLPKYLKDLGYSTHLVGKWHLGECSVEALPQKRGFDTFLGFLSSYVGYYNLSTVYRHKKQTTGLYDFWNGTEIFRTDGSTYIQDILDQEIAGILERSRTSKEPFFILHATPLPHAPLESPPHYHALYSNVDEPRRTYLGMLSRLDESVRNTVRSLETNGLLNDTYVIFMSDNGGMSNSHPIPYSDGFSGNNYPLRGSKGTLYEGGVRVPAFVSSPLIPDQLQGRTTDKLFHITDWLPTIVSMAGGQGILPDDLDGVDQSGMLLLDRKSSRESVVIQLYDPFSYTPPSSSDSAAALIWNDYKLILGSALLTDSNGDLFYSEEWSQPAEWKTAGFSARAIRGTNCGSVYSSRPYCLFNIKADPFETIDIADTSETIVEVMLQMIRNETRRIRPSINRYPFYKLPMEAVIDQNGALKPGYCDVGKKYAKDEL